MNPAEIEAEAKRVLDSWMKPKMNKEEAFKISSQLVSNCFRNNTIIEAIHGDGGLQGMSYDKEMEVICKHPTLGYDSRINNLEMKRLMQEATTNIMDALMYPEAFQLRCKYMPVPDYWTERYDRK